MAADNLSPVPRRLLGLAMIGLIVALLALCIAAYNKVFTSSVQVTMEIDQVDNSFLPQADVRMRGVTVGTVSKVSTNGSMATLTLELAPNQIAHIPRNVTAALLPKSLFGERYVALETPKNPSPQTIRAGDVITRDRSSSTIEIEQVFNNLLPLLQAVRPSDLATTLGALNQALSGRGAELGDTIVRLHQYLSQLNPALPDLTKDIQALPKTTDTYSTAAPDLIEGLANLTTTTRTLDEKQDEFNNLYSTLTNTSDDLTGFLRDNRSNLIDLASTARPTLELLDRYSPEYVCLLRRMADAVPRTDKIFGKDTPRPALHITLEVAANRGKYVPHQDEPDYTDNRGPACYHDTPPLPQYPGGPYQDGSTHPPGSSQSFQLGSLISGSSPVPGAPSLPLFGGMAGGQPDGLLTGRGPGSSVGAPALAGLSLANSQPERQLISGLVAGMTGTRPADAPAWSSLLVGPLLRGAEVHVQ
jgi:virulence factor Mce-like protein